MPNTVQPERVRASSTVARGSGLTLQGATRSSTRQVFRSSPWERTCSAVEEEPGIGSVRPPDGPGVDARGGLTTEAEDMGQES